MRQSILLIHNYAANYKSLPDHIRNHPLYQPQTDWTAGYPAGTGSGSNGPLLRGYSMYWAVLVDPNKYAKNKALMCATDWTTSWAAGNWTWRYGTNGTPARDPDSFLPGGFSVTQQPYYKAVLPGISLWHHMIWEPNGHFSLWHKGLDDIWNNNEQGELLVCDPTPASHRITIKPNPKRTFPMLVCPTWFVAPVHPDFPNCHTPHDKREIIPNGLTYQEGGPLSRNIGFSDGHVEWWDRQRSMY
jgi:hypothetical protein